MIDLPPDPDINSNKITYTYDSYDRLYLKNYYLGTVGRKKGSWYGFKGQRIPKKLLYQDIYRYKSNVGNGVMRIDRVYQPVISIPVLTRVGSNVTSSTTIFCKSPILGSGFVMGLSEQELNGYTLYPSPGMFRPIDLSSFHFRVFVGNQGLGELSWSFTQASTVYIRAFCTIETGLLFTKAVSI